MKILSIFLGLCALCGSAAMTSCSDKADFIGSWKANSVANVVPQQSSAIVSSLTAIDFSENQEKSDGMVVLTNAYDIVETVALDSASTGTSEMHITATVSAEGSWTYDVDDKDDLLLSFDLSSVNVTVDPKDIAFVPDVTGDLRERIVDNAVNVWKRELTRSFRDELSRYSVVDDIEVSKDGGAMSLEIHSPEAEVHFRRVIP